MGELTLESEVEIDVEELSQEIGSQWIIEGKGKPFSYLAGLALDGMSGPLDPVQILMEFLREEPSFDLREEELETIEELLRETYRP